MDELLKASSRRQFLSRVGMTAAVAQVRPGEGVLDASEPSQDKHLEDSLAPVDFRYAPVRQQTAICFPDDAHKSLVGENGELRLGHPGPAGNLDQFATITEFSLGGMEPDVVRGQRLEAPGIPILHTRIERPEASLEITAFSSRQPGEGRVDNVLLEVRPRKAPEVAAVPVVILKEDTNAEVVVKACAGGSVVSTEGKRSGIVFASDSPVLLDSSSIAGHVLTLPHGVASERKPLRHFLRFPQEGQPIAAIENGLQDPQRILDSVRQFWKEWKPFGGNVAWQLPPRYHEFLTACARNIQQAREVKDGKLTFQVGPTVYRGLWVVDGNFILEAARYLGYDREAQHGLETTWSRQEPGGGVFAAGGHEYWKDTGIALFSLVRQAELAQDYSYFREMQPNALRAIGFLQEVRKRAKNDGSANGRYGLLAPGFADGGIGGIRSEFTNTLWVLAGLKATVETAARLNIPAFDDARSFYEDLRAAFVKAARQEMQDHPAGFKYLPMVAKDDPTWREADPWNLPRPQSAQWALSHAIFPGLVFAPNDPIVEGHIRLMQACTREDIPAETGWIAHGGLWNYNAPFVSEVYLWAGLRDWARRTFHGFLNHATPSYCWREEQPLRGSLTASYVGDMPHNWASAECVRYLRHMLVLEDAWNLRLLAGIGDPELAASEPLQVRSSPTRFGRIDVTLEPLDRNAGWRLQFRRGSGPAPARLTMPSLLGRRLRFAGLTGANSRVEGERILVDSQARTWEAQWKA